MKKRNDIQGHRTNADGDSPALRLSGRDGALRINEVMVENNNSIVDDYGRRGAWIELFNSTSRHWRFPAYT